VLEYKHINEFKENTMYNHTLPNPRPKAPERPKSAPQAVVAWQYRLKNSSGWTAWLTTASAEKPVKGNFNDIECRPLVYADSAAERQAGYLEGLEAAANLIEYMESNTGENFAASIRALKADSVSTRSASLELVLEALDTSRPIARTTEAIKRHADAVSFMEGEVSK